MDQVEDGASARSDLVTAAALASSIVRDEEDHPETADAEVAAEAAAYSSERMSLAEGFRSGGVGIALVLLLFTVLEEFDRVALQVLGPDIQASLGISDTLLLGLQSFGGVVLVLATMPFAWLADRASRVRVLSAMPAVMPVFIASVTSSMRTMKVTLNPGQGISSSRFWAKKPCFR